MTPIADDIMYEEPKILAFHFLFTRPDASEEDARIFAKPYFLASPVIAADFVIEWAQLRQRFWRAGRAPDRKHHKTVGATIGPTTLQTSIISGDHRLYCLSRLQSAVFL